MSCIVSFTCQRNGFWNCILVIETITELSSCCRVHIHIQYEKRFHIQVHIQSEKRFDQATCQRNGFWNCFLNSFTNEKKGIHLPMKNTLPSCRVARLPSCRVAELPGCRVAELPSCQVAELPGCRVAG